MRQEAAVWRPRVVGTQLAMEHWDLRSLDVEPHQPQILQSAQGEGRSIVIRLPAGEQLQDHEVHERAFLTVIDGEVDVEAGETVSGGPGSFFVFAPHERHEVRATSDARLLLVLAPWPGQGHPGARDAG
jgi:quercetin dioxygenase-like cupin family protein